MTDFFRRLFSWPTLALLGVGTFMGALGLWLSRKNEINNLKDALKVQQLKKDVQGYQSKVDKLVADASVNRGELAFVQAELAESQRRAAQIATGVDLEGMTDEEVAAVFRARLS